MSGPEPPLAAFSVPEILEIDGPLIARLVSAPDVPTIAPAFVLNRAGFTREGVKRRYLRHGGERVDATSYSLLADE